MQMIQDAYGRTFKTLRVSLLNTCNLGCVYCTMGSDDVKSSNALVGKKHMDSVEFLSIIQQLHARLGLKTVRLTGGEPLLYPHLKEVVKGIKALGIQDISLTTNGFLLARMVDDLKAAGLRSVNVSLDAVDEDVFFLMSRRNQVDKILKGIEKAKAAGLEVKINTVLMKGLNDGQVLPLLQYAFQQGIPIRFLEVMAMGHLHKNAADYLVTKHEILQTISEVYNIMPVVRKASATANYWQTEEGHLFGIIANESAPFCHDCNRLRLDSNGNIYGCLSSNTPISLKNSHGMELDQKLALALAQKQTLKFKGSELSMLQIGG